MIWEIRPNKDGYAIYKDGVFITWCYDMKYAEYRLEALQKEI